MIEKLFVAADEMPGVPILGRKIVRDCGWLPHLTHHGHVGAYAGVGGDYIVMIEWDSWSCMPLMADLLPGVSYKLSEFGRPEMPRWVDCELDSARVNAARNLEVAGTLGESADLTDGRGHRRPGGASCSVRPVDGLPLFVRDLSELRDWDVLAFDGGEAPMIYQADGIGTDGWLDEMIANAKVWVVYRSGGAL